MPGLEVGTGWRCVVVYLCAPDPHSHVPFSSPSPSHPPACIPPRPRTRSYEPRSDAAMREFVTGLGEDPDAVLAGGAAGGGGAGGQAAEDEDDDVVEQGAGGRRNWTNTTCPLSLKNVSEGEGEGAAPCVCWRPETRSAYVCTSVKEHKEKIAFVHVCVRVYLRVCVQLHACVCVGVPRRTTHAVNIN